MREISVPLRSPLVAARFVERPNRFEVVARLDEGLTADEPDGHRRRHSPDGLARAHLADPGRLKELLLRDRKMWLQPVADPRRRTAWSAVLVESEEGVLVSLDTQLPNRLIRLAFEQQAMSEFDGWHLLRAEAALGKSRMDFLLEDALGSQLYVEVKSVTLAEQQRGLFPDAVTARGARHVRELADAVTEDGLQAAILFVAQRADIRSVQAARHIDADFAQALDDARSAGVRILARGTTIEKGRLILANPLTVLDEA